MHKMFCKLIAAILTITNCNATILLWSKSKFAISPLISFTDTNLEQLAQEMGYPEISIYKINSDSVPQTFKKVLEGYHSAYIPNGEINTENATELSGLEDFDLLKLKQRLESTESNILSILALENHRFRREISPNTSTISSTSTYEPTYPYNAPTGPIFYKGESVTDQTFGLMYSSKPLLLKRVNGTKVYLGMPPQSDMITVDTKSRESYARLNINIPVDDNKITLRFKFLLSVGYWSLISVKVSDTSDLFNFNMTIQQEVQAPFRFSYHCSGTTVFSDAEKVAELHLYDLQVQIDSASGIFDDAYDCINFTTVPIWSGLFVAALLGVGLIIALTAIIDIKTMDKFDNQKTKNMTITCQE